MANDPFVEPLLKVQRAKHHIADLNGKVNAYLAKRPFKLFLAQYPEIAQAQLRIETNPPVPDEFALIIGDAIHNLHAALDILMFGIVGKSAKNPDAVFFPFCAKADGLESTISRTQIHLAPEGVIRAIRTLKPYPDGNPDLCAIHRLDIQDKHKLLQPVGRNAELREDDFRRIAPGILSGPPKGVRFVFVGDSENPILMKIDIVDTPLAAIARIYEEAKIQPTFSICFAKREFFGHEVAIPTLQRFTNAVELALAEIRKGIG